MKSKTYNEIIGYVDKNSSNHLKCLNELCSKYPEFERSSITSIMGQEVQRKVKKTIHFHTSAATKYYSSYLAAVASRADADVILKMSMRLRIPACLLARILLERYLSSISDHVNKKCVGNMLKEPQSIGDAVLCRNIQLCLLADKFYGPIADVTNRSLGHEYEVELRRKLKQHNIPFHDESYLRSRGYDKTPDVVLQLPIGVEHRVINWIESKALFGDPRCHHRYNIDQYSTYNNRFGPGLVIYWLGYTDDLQTLQNNNLAIVDHFPNDFVALNITVGP